MSSSGALVIGQSEGLRGKQPEDLVVVNGVAGLLTRQDSSLQVLFGGLLSCVALAGGVGCACTLDHWLL